MPLTQQNPKYLILENVTVVYDGITRPEALEAKPGQAPGMKWNVKVVFPQNHPDAHLLDQLAQQELQVSEFQGVLPRGGNMPLGDVGPSEFNGMFPGHKVINASTFRQPDVRDENGAQLSPHEYGPMFYNGQCVDLIIHCAAYNNVSKGVATRLDGIRILTSRNAQRLNIGGGGFDAGSVWGNGQDQQQPQQQPQQQQQQWGGQQPQQQPQQQQQPPQGQQGQQWDNGQNQQQPPQGQQGQQWDNGNNGQNQSPAPQQNNNWMPQQ